MEEQEIKKVAQDYADGLSGEGDYFEEIEKAVIFGIRQFENINGCLFCTS